MFHERLVLLSELIIAQSHHTSNKIDFATLSQTFVANRETSFPNNIETEICRFTIAQKGTYRITGVIGGITTVADGYAMVYVYKNSSEPVVFVSSVIERQSVSRYDVPLEWVTQCDDGDSIRVTITVNGTNGSPRYRLGTSVVISRIN